MPVTEAHRRALARLRPPPGGWYHGTDNSQGLFQRDPHHPGIWAANTLRAALWYAHHPTRPGVIHTLTLPPLPTLNDPATLTALCQLAGLSPTAVRRAHRAGTLYLTHQEPLCAAARHAGYPGLIMRDHTERPHLSAVLWTATPHVTGTAHLTPNGDVHWTPTPLTPGAPHDPTA